MSFFIISALLNAFVSGMLGFLIILKNKKETINRLFLALSLSVVFWSLSYWQWLSAASETSALFWIRLVSICSLFIPIFFFHWIIVFLGISGFKKKLIKIFYLIVSLFLLSSFSSFFVEGVEPKLIFPFWPNPGVIYSLYLFFVYTALTAYTIYTLFKHYKLNEGTKKSSIKYIIWGSLVGFGGGATNFFLWYDIHVLPYGNILVSFYPLVLAFAIFRYQLFNIKIITTELLVFTIWIFLLGRTLLAQNLQEGIINGGLLAFVVFFGILLIRSVLKEVRMREKIEGLARSLDSANKKLRKLDQAKTEFLSIASHQLRAPLTSTKGYASMILEGSFGKISEKIQKPVERIYQSSNRLFSIIGDFLDVSRIELGKMEYEFTEFDLRELVNNLVEEFKVSTRKPGIKLEFICKEEKVNINADYNKLRQVISNLIDNALKYTNGGFIKASLSKTDKSVLISVKDTGNGMSKEDIGKLFQKFSRSKSASKSHTQGSGLGLYVANEIIKVHKGKIWAESDGAGEGSTFYVELPLGGK